MEVSMEVSLNSLASPAAERKQDGLIVKYRQYALVHLKDKDVEPHAASQPLRRYP